MGQIKVCKVYEAFILFFLCVTKLLSRIPTGLLKVLQCFVVIFGTEIDNVLIIFCKTIYWFVNMSNTLILYKKITTKHVGYPAQSYPNPK